MRSEAAGAWPAASPTPVVQSYLSIYAVVFEDDAETGYLYGLDLRWKDAPIVDALQIYNADSVTDKKEPSAIHMLWSADAQRCLLRINDHPHAAFDFHSRQGYCRSNFPPNAKWTTYSHEWDDDVLKYFQ